MKFFTPIKVRKRSLSCFLSTTKSLFVLLFMATLFCSFTEKTETMQSVAISGTVTDLQNEPLPGVTVTVKGTAIGVISDVNGKYSINVPDKNAILVFSFIGYVTQEINIGNQTIVNVMMKDATTDIGEVVVVGFGSQKKINLTGSVASISSDDLTKRSTPNTSVALQGLIPGVSVVQSSGQPGADEGSITIRGTGSIYSSTSPLILIDGVEGNLNTVDMNAIESISVLKDAASASIYGSRASNGVILVTTKRGYESKLKVSYNAYFGLNRPTELPDPVDAIGYMEAINTARANGGLDPQYSDDYINLYKTQGADNMTRFDTNWRDLVLKNSAFMQNHSLSVRGGSKQIGYYANAGYYFQDGLIANNNYSRMTLRMNMDAHVTDWMTIGLDVDMRQHQVTKPSQQDPTVIIGKTITFTPVFSGRNDDGTWGLGQNGDNPLAIAEAGGVNHGVTPNTAIRGFLRLTPFKGFEALASYSNRNQQYKVNSFIRQYDTYEGGVYKTTYPATPSTANESWSQALWNQFTAQISYEKTIANHYIKGLAGMQTEEYINKSFGATRSGYDYPGFEEITHGDVASATNWSGHTERALVAYFGRFNYIFDNRYLLELTGRWDLSSRFLPENRLGFFPSVSAGWRISEEPFFEPLKESINSLKIRASYGTLGNQDIGSDYPYIALLNTGYGYRFNKVLGSGVTQTAMANPLISWETSRQKNAGLDLAMFRSRLKLEFDYYIRNINNLLQQFPTPAYVGLTNAFSNGGSMRNNGWEFLLIWNDKIGDVGYKILANIADVKNKITDLNGHNPYINPDNTTQEGYPIYSWYGYVSDGFFHSQKEIDDATAVYGGDKSNIKPGYVRYKDISGPDGVPDGVIDADHDRKIIGDPFPRYQFGLSLGADWKNFDLSIFLQGVGKKDILQQNEGARPFFNGRTVFKYQLDTWTPQNPNAEYPLLLLEGQAGSNPNNIVSDFWIKSGAYMRVKNVVVGYKLPAKMLNKVGIDNLRFYVNAQNLFTISNAYSGYDPENGVSNGNFYPVMKTFTFGVDLRF
jgi:TonB-linked SusC/RagA family outer membrane protein